MPLNSNSQANTENINVFHKKKKQSKDFCRQIKAERVCCPQSFTIKKMLR